MSETSFIKLGKHSINIEENWLQQEINIDDLTISPKDLEVENFKIDISQILVDLSTDFATAYPASYIEDSKNLSDNSQYYALVFKNNLPIRLVEILLLKYNKCPNIISPAAASLTKINNELHFAVIISKPPGRSLKSLIDAGINFDDSFILNKLLKPLLTALNELHKYLIAHGRINIENIFITQDAEIVLAEFISEPCGYSQDTFCETIERAQAHKYGKGTPDVAVEYYALGMTIFNLLSRKDFKLYEDKELIRLKLFKGTYNFLISENYLVGRIADLIKGLVIDNPIQRWGFVEVEALLNNKNYNSSNLVDKSYLTKPIIFNGKELYSCKALAYELSQSWEMAKSFIKTDKIKKWLQHYHTQEKTLELLESITTLIYTSKTPDLKGFIIEDDKLIKTLIILDPYGPIRMNEVSFHKSGLGLLMLYSINEQHTSLTQILIKFLVSNVFEIFESIASSTDKKIYNMDLIKIYKCSQFIKKTEVGFGIDRCIYELNPTLPCQSTIFKEDFCLSVSDLLYKLDKILISFDDLLSKKNITAFIAAKIGAIYDYKIKELEAFPQLQSNKILQIANLLAIAQKYFKLGKLEKLCDKLRNTLKEILEAYLKSSKIKEILFNKIDLTVEYGIIMDTLKAGLSLEFLTKNIQGYENAVKRAAKITLEIARYNNSKYLYAQLREKSLKVFVQLSYIICWLVLVNLILKSL